jgi:hypothetical protein
VLLKAKIRQQVRQRSLHSLLLAAVDCEIRANNEAQAARIKKQDIRAGRGVRQGMPLSPFFANLFLAGFDRACVAKAIYALRYADDLIFFATSESEAKELADFCGSELKQLKLAIPQIDPESKSQIYAPDDAAEFLGVELAPSKGGGYQVRIGQKQLDVIKSAIYDMGSLAELRQRNLDVTRFGNSLAARCSAFAAAYDFCDNVKQLELSMGAWAKSTRMKIAMELGVDIASLSPNARWFLALD